MAQRQQLCLPLNVLWKLEYYFWSSPTRKTFLKRIFNLPPQSSICYWCPQEMTPSQSGCLKTGTSFPYHPHQLLITFFSSHLSIHYFHILYLSQPVEARQLQRVSQFVLVIMNKKICQNFNKEWNPLFTWNNSKSSIKVANFVKLCLPLPPTPRSNAFPRGSRITLQIRAACSMASRNITSFIGVLVTLL